MLQEVGLGSLFEFFSSLLYVVELLVDDIMHLFIEIDEFTASMERITSLNKRVDHWPHTFVILAKDSLEDSEVEVCHLEYDFIKDVQISGSLRILIDVKEWCLQALHNHIIPIYYFLW